MSTPEVEPLEATLNQFFEGLDEPLEEIRGHLGKTDVDFINDQGSFDPNLRKGNDQGIQDTLRAFNKALSEKDIAKIAEAHGVSTQRIIAIRSVLAKSIGLRSERSGAQFETIQKIPKTIEQFRPEFIANAENVDEMVDWWSNPAPFVVFQSIKTHMRHSSTKMATVYAPGTDRLEMKVDGGRRPIDHRDTISSSFTGGREVIVGFDGKNVERFYPHEGELWDRTVNFVGWDGIRGTHETPMDFLGISYNRFLFLDGESKPLAKLEDAHLFAARLAVAELVEDGLEMDIDLVDKPSNDFKKEILYLLGDHAVAAFLPPVQQASVIEGGGRMVGYQVGGVSVNEKFNQMRSLTETQLKSALKAADSNVADLYEIVMQEIHKLENSGSLDARIQAIRVIDNVQALFNTL
ncbi:MAG: hypothetical protein M3P98_00730 [bacterium]|nr:hypothetical protein [bacterium]